MKEKINVSDYAQHIQEALPRGILLNTMGDKFNAMVIGWGHLGVIWGRRTFVVYVREGRYTKPQLDKTGEFTVSIPLEGPDGVINRVCGSLSGRDVDKVKEAGLTLAEPSVIRTPGILEYPITLECRVLYSQELDPAAIPDKDIPILAGDICRDISSQLKFPGLIKVTVIRELRCVEYAK